MNSRCVGSLIVRCEPILFAAITCLVALGALIPARAVSEEVPSANDKPAAKIEEVSPEERLKRVIALGATKESEAALQNGLRWLASVQDRDGGWNFDTQSINIKTADPGTADKARNAATGLALLPFLAAGYTHTVEGPYQATVKKGLAFLQENINRKQSLPEQGRYSWHEEQGTMYSHGLATAALCEAYALTKDKKLRTYAEGGLKFIAEAQDPNGGGWRYTPRMPGDTSVLGWQFAALKSGAMGELKIEPLLMTKLVAFLDHVSDPKDVRAYYGYTGPGKGPATTAIGLLCRMHTGWKKEELGLKMGVDFLAKLGPHPTNYYFNYYATEVLHQWGGAEWTDWNRALRQDLLSTQTTAGPDQGSWFSGGKDHATERGGRLYNTALACLMLEVHYRYPRVLEKKSGESGGLVY